MHQTPFTLLLNIDLPLQLAPMGNMTPPDLVAAVTNAGGLGMYSAPNVPPEPLRTVLHEIREKVGDKPFGVGFLMPFLDPVCAQIAAELSDTVEFFYDVPNSELVEAVHIAGALCGWQIGSTDEARAAADAGCDYVVAQGIEAGGHVRGTTPLLDLLTAVAQSVSVPIVASGGLGDADTVARAFDAGAHAVRIGTRFLAAAESVAHPEYIEALIAAKADDTTMTTAYSVMWPDAPHRVLASSIEAAHAAPDEIVGEMVLGDERQPVPKFLIVPPDRDTTGNIRAMALYAGRSVEHVRTVQPAAEIVRELLLQTPWSDHRSRERH